MDRSAAYAARYVAKNLVASGVCDKATAACLCDWGDRAASVYVNTHNTSKYSSTELEKCVKSVFKLTPKGIIESLDLLRPIYSLTSAYGHFGRELEEFTWEKTNKAEEIQAFFKR